MKPSGMDSQDCDAELCIHLAPICIAAFTRGATFTNEHLFLRIAALQHVLCILSSAPFSKGFPLQPYWKYPPSAPPPSLFTF